MSPWRKRRTFFDRCRLTAVKPISSKRPFSRSGSGEVNSTVADVRGRTAAVEEQYAKRDGVTVDHLDGLTVSLPDGSWFNLRPSNTEPLLRLNVEARHTAVVEALRDEVLALVRGVDNSPRVTAGE